MCNDASVSSNTKSYNFQCITFVTDDDISILKVDCLCNHNRFHVYKFNLEPCKLYIQLQLKR